MTNEELKIFRERYRNIILLKSQLTNKYCLIGMLYCIYDKNDGNTKRINDSVDFINETKGKLTELLNCKTYDEWKILSRQIHDIQEVVKRGTLIKATKARQIFEKIDLIDFICKKDLIDLI